MLLVAHWLVIFVFWFFILKIFRNDGFGIPAVFVVLWIAGYILSPRLGLAGGIVFTSYGAILGLILIYVDMVRDKMGSRNKAMEATRAMQVPEEISSAHDPQNDQ